MPNSKKNSFRGNFSQIYGTYYFVLGFLFSKMLSKYIFCLAWFCFGIWNNLKHKKNGDKIAIIQYCLIRFIDCQTLGLKFLRKNLVEMLLDFNFNSTSKRNSNHCAWWPSPTFYVHISQWKNFINSNFLTEKVCEQKQFGYSPNLNYQVFGVGLGEIRLWSLQLFALEYILL